MQNLTLKQKIELAKQLKAGKKAQSEIVEIRKELLAIKSLYTAERDPDLSKTILKKFDEVFEKLVDVARPFPQELKISNLPSGINVLNFPKQLDFPTEIEVSNLKEFPKKMLVGSKDIAETARDVGLISKFLHGLKEVKAIITGQVFITNKEAKDAIPVVLTDATKKFFYNAINQYVAGAGGGSRETKIENKSGVTINPATDGIGIGDYDYVSVDYPLATVEVYSFYKNPATLSATVTVVYTDATKNNLLSATRT